MADTQGKPIQCKAAVCWEPKKPLSIETITVAPPKAGEVRVKITHTGICHSDANIVNGANPCKLPVVLGHEAAGIIESVGDGVTNVKAGDHVLPMFLPECDKCRSCKSGKTNICEEFMSPTYAGGVLLDGTPRFICNGQPVYHFFDTSTFSQYSTMPAHSVVKINPEAPLEKVCLLGCGILTGYGTAVNTARVEPGSVCAVWGLGCIGLAAVMGCKAAGASRIIGVDINPAKFELGKQFGLTEFINPKECGKPVDKVIMERTEGGLDYAFEAIGNIDTMRTAFDSLHNGWGKLSIIGLAPEGHEFKSVPWDFLLGRTVTGAFYGDFKRKAQVPEMVEKYMRKEVMVDEFITHTMKLDRINDAFQLMKDGKSLRSVVEMF